MSPAALRELAERVAREAGAQLLEAFGGPAVAVEAKSTPTDLVSGRGPPGPGGQHHRQPGARAGGGGLPREG